MKTTEEQISDNAKEILFSMDTFVIKRMTESGITGYEHFILENGDMFTMMMKNSSSTEFFTQYIKEYKIRGIAACKEGLCLLTSDGANGDYKYMAIASTLLIDTSYAFVVSIIADMWEFLKTELDKRLDEFSKMKEREMNIFKRFKI